MHVTRFSRAKPYETKLHHDMCALQLQGGAESEARYMSLGMSHFLPGGGAERSASPTEKIYLVLAGEIVLVTDNGEVALRQFDSCLLAPGEARSIENRGQTVATMAVIISKPEVAA